MSGRGTGGRGPAGGRGGSSQAAKRENGTPAEGKPAVETASKGASGWGKGPSFAAVLSKTVAQQAPQAPARAEEGVNKPDAESPKPAGVPADGIQFGSFGPEGNASAESGAKGVMPTEGPRPYLRTSSAPPGTGQPQVNNATFIPEKAVRSRFAHESGHANGPTAASSTAASTASGETAQTPTSAGSVPVAVPTTAPMAPAAPPAPPAARPHAVPVAQQLVSQQSGASTGSGAGEHAAPAPGVPPPPGRPASAANGPHHMPRGGPQAQGGFVPQQSRVAQGPRGGPGQPGAEHGGPHQGPRGAQQQAFHGVVRPQAMPPQAGFHPQQVQGYGGMQPGYPGPPMPGYTGGPGFQMGNPMQGPAVISTMPAMMLVPTAQGYPQYTPSPYGGAPMSHPVGVPPFNMHGPGLATSPPSQGFIPPPHTQGMPVPGMGAAAGGGMPGGPMGMPANMVQPGAGGQPHGHALGAPPPPPPPPQGAHHAPGHHGHTASAGSGHLPAGAASTPASQSSGHLPAVAGAPGQQVQAAGAGAAGAGAAAGAAVAGAKPPAAVPPPRKVLTITDPKSKAVVNLPEAPIQSTGAPAAPAAAAGAAAGAAGAAKPAAPAGDKPAGAPAPVVAPPPKESAARAIKPPTPEQAAKSHNPAAISAAAAAAVPSPSPTLSQEGKTEAAAAPAPSPAKAPAPAAPAAQEAPAPTKPAAPAAAVEPQPNGGDKDKAPAPAPAPIQATSPVPAPGAEEPPTPAPSTPAVEETKQTAGPSPPAATQPPPPPPPPAATAPPVQEAPKAAPPAPAPAPVKAATPEPAAAAAAAAPKAPTPEPPKAAPTPEPVRAPTPEAKEAPAPASAEPASEAAGEEGSDQANGSGSGGGAAGNAPKTKKSLKDIGKRGDMKDQEIARSSDPFAPKPPMPPPSATPAEPPAAAKASAASAKTSKNVSPERAPQGEASEPVVSDNWESAAEEDGGAAGAGGSSANLAGAGISQDGRRIYSRDYMKRLATLEQCQARPDFPLEFMQTYATDILLKEPRAFESFNIISGGPAMVRPPRMQSGNLGGGGGSGNWDRPGRGPPQGDRFQDARMGGPRGSMGPGGPRGMDRVGSRNMGDDGKWERRGPPPPPSPGGRGQGGRGPPPGANLPALHRTENRFVAGQTRSEDPEEEKKQKTFQGILNKITPDNFERLTNKIMEVGIKERITLEGLIDKIFDKALTDTHFSELYSNMCNVISQHPDTPKFPPEDGASKPVDFRRLLLNKCQVEFETGSRAMDSVAEQEKQQEGTEGSGGGAPPQRTSEGGNKPAEEAKPEEAKEKEEGEITPPPSPGPEQPDRPLTEAEKAAAAKAALDKARAARRRMLGNIQFIGYLYKNGLLTERILHSCIAQLLKEESDPRPEDIECLCKLLTTVGQLLDKTTKPELKKAMEVYFMRMQRVKDVSKLESRIKFMIQDVLEMRQKGWRARRVQEGPKKIEDVHREAARELEAQAQRDMDERRGGRRGGDRGPPGPPPRGGPGFDRLMSKDEVPSKALNFSSSQRQASADLSLRPPQFGARARGASPSPAAAAAAAAAGARDQGPGGRGPGPARSGDGRGAAPAAAPAPPPPRMDIAAIKTAANGLVEEYHSARDVEEALAVLASLRSKGADMGEVLKALVESALNIRSLAVEDRLPLLRPLVAAALEREPAKGGISPAELESGAKALQENLHVLCDEFAKGPGLVGLFLGEFMVEGPLSLAVLSTVLEVPPQDEGVPDAPLVDMGAAIDVVIGAVTTIKAAKGEEAAAAAWKSSGLDVTKFFDEMTRENPDDMKRALEKPGLTFLLPQ